jgi:hypothetical protein
MVAQAADHETLTARAGPRLERKLATANLRGGRLQVFSLACRGGPAKPAQGRPPLSQRGAFYGRPALTGRRSTHAYVVMNFPGKAAGEKDE